MAKLINRPQKKFSIKRFESELLNCVNHLVEALPSRTTDEFSDEFFNEVLCDEQPEKCLLESSFKSHEEMSSTQILNELEDPGDFSGFLDFAKVENVHIQLLEAFNKENTDISIDELIDSVEFCKEDYKKYDSGKSIEKECLTEYIPIKHNSVEKELMCRTEVNLKGKTLKTISGKKQAKKFMQHKHLKTKNNASDCAKYRAQINYGQNLLWNACHPYIVDKDFEPSLDCKIVPKAVSIVNNLKAQNRLVLKEKDTLKQKQIELLKTLITQLKRIEMPTKMKKRQIKRKHWLKRKPTKKLSVNLLYQDFDGFDSSDVSSFKQCIPPLTSVKESDCYSAIDIEDSDATFSGFESSDDENCASSFYGFNGSVVNKDLTNDLFSSSPLCTSYNLSDNIPNLNYIFAPLKDSSKIIANVPVVKDSEGLLVRKSNKRTRSGSIQVRQMEECLSESLLSSASNPCSNYYYEHNSFMVKSKENDGNPLKMKIIRKEESLLESDSDVKIQSHSQNSNKPLRSNAEVKRIKREIKHPEKYAAYITDGLKANIDSKMILKTRLQNLEERIKLKLEDTRNQESLTVMQEPQISASLLNIDSAIVVNANTSPSLAVNDSRYVKSTSDGPINGKKRKQQTLNSFSSKNSNASAQLLRLRINKAGKPPYLLKEIKENKSSLTDNLSYLKEMYLKRNGHEATIIDDVATKNMKSNHVNAESNWSNTQIGEYLDNTVEMGNLFNDKNFNNGGSFLDFDGHSLKTRTSSACLTRSTSSGYPANINYTLKNVECVPQSKANQNRISSLATNGNRVISSEAILSNKSFRNGWAPPSSCSSINLKRDFPCKNVPKPTPVPKLIPKMPQLIPYYSLTSANINNAILSKSKYPKLGSANTLLKESINANIKSQRKEDLHNVKYLGHGNEANEQVDSITNSLYFNEEVPSTVSSDQYNNLLLAPIQGLTDLPLSKPMKPFDKTLSGLKDVKSNNFEVNVVKPPILQKQHKCSNCDFVTTKLGVFKRHQLMHSATNFIADEKNTNISRLPDHTSPVKEIFPVVSDYIDMDSITTTTAILKPFLGYDERVQSLMMPLRDTPMPLLPNERLHLKSWTRIEKLELMWCYYYSCCNAFPKENSLSRLKSTLLKRGKISRDKISSDCLLKIVFSVLSSKRIRAQDIYPIKINAEITARKEIGCSSHLENGN